MFTPSPPPPDLTTKHGRKAWRHELRMVAVRPRRWGLWMMTAGCLLMLLPSATGIHAILGWSPSLLGMILIILASPCLFVAARLRRRHRMTRAGHEMKDGLS